MSIPLNSFRKMLESKLIRRTDKGMFIPLAEIHLREGWNARFETAALIDSFHEMARFLILDEEQKILKDLNNLMPQVEVIPRPEGGVWVVEGHRRIRTYRLLENLGYKLPLIGIKPFEGNEAQRKARIINSNKQLELSPLEKAYLLLDMADNDNQSNSEIAALTGMTRQQVEQLIKLARAPKELQEQVQEGIIAAGTAVKALYNFGDETPAVVARIYQEGGGKKVLPKAINSERELRAAASKPAKPATPSVPKGLATDLLDSASRLTDELTPESLELIERYRAGEDLLGDMPVTLTVRSINALVATTRHVAEVYQEKRRKCSGEDE